MSHALDDIIAYFLAAPELVPKGKTAGLKKALHVEWKGRDVFGLIANAEWLLWYFRRPGVTCGLFEYSELLETFPDAKMSGRSEKDKAELTLRIRNLDDAQRLLVSVDKLFR
ncbi:hypothetical protein GQ651_09030 [Alphaproteobacteria bacterium GH1-50]|uniref:YdhG-like domain-containing protein n=1 Tax=Kangsaoukella pontilimi TaxID=2691042 RepID=A0A7C9IGJ4_9RHOB|nr:hypothetical protein [Kangsaoukella pontilimi]MXQ07987.1 hypothetical protein [Kangsaoukella pontilimi]